MRQAKIKRFNALDYTGTEAINTICTNLSFSGRDCKRIAFTSFMPGAGKTYMCLNILHNMAKRGKRVLMIDADLRRSSVVSRLRLETEGEMYGLAHYLAGHCELGDCIYETNMYGACIMPAGRDISSPMTLIDTPYFGEMLDHLAPQFDLVLIDTPPVGVVVDAEDAEAFSNVFFNRSLFAVEKVAQERGVASWWKPSGRWNNPAVRLSAASSTR